MAEIVRGPTDELVLSVQKALNAYEEQHPGAVATLYRQNSGSIRVRIVDERFSGRSKAQRHHEVVKYIADRLGGDDIQEISVLLLLSPSELSTSFMNAEFDDPIKSDL